MFIDEVIKRMPVYRGPFGATTHGGLAAVPHPTGGLWLVPEEVLDYAPEGGLAGPLPADASIMQWNDADDGRVRNGYSLNILGGGGKSGLRTFYGGMPQLDPNDDSLLGVTQGGVGVSWHAEGILAKLDPITIDTVTNGIGLTAAARVIPTILWIVGLAIFIFSLVCLALAIIKLFTPGM